MVEYLRVFHHVGFFLCLGILEVEQAQNNWVARAAELPRSASTAGIAFSKRCYGQLQSRYGPRYTSAMLSAAFVGFVLPLPGSSLIGVGLVVVIAEVHRAFSGGTR